MIAVFVSLTILSLILSFLAGRVTGIQKGMEWAEKLHYTNQKATEELCTKKDYAKLN